MHTAAADSSCSADCEEAADGSVESATAVVVDTSLRKEEGISESSWSIGDIDHLGIQTKIQMVDVIENPSTWTRGVSELTEDAKFILRPDWTDVDEKVK